ncbi:MAG: hypothetical protein V7709_06540 [Halioglobus sp.]
MKRCFGAGLILLLSGCSRIDSLLMEPNITPEQWCDGMPCVEILSTGVILNQPFSSLLVYLLGLMWIWAGLRFWNTAEGQASKLWWCISLMLGGVAAISAGTSYQAFGYELKCAGRELCVWTNGWEIAYMILQVGSFNAMLVAVAHSCTTGVLRRVLIVYAGINFILHFVVTLVGIYTPDRFLLSFELLVLFITPSILMVFFINVWRYTRYRQLLDLVLLGNWALLFVANTAYYAYLSGGYTQRLWEQGVWFSENDVLHVLVAVWVFYVGRVLVERVHDYTVPRP